MKKRVSFLLALLMCISLCFPASAAEAEPNFEYATVATIWECEQAKIQRMQDMIAYTNAIENQLTLNGLHGESRTEYGQTVIKEKKGTPGGQGEYGHSFTDCSGSLSFTQTGGPTANISFSISIPISRTVSIPVEFGYKLENTSASAINVNIPNDCPKVGYIVDLEKWYEITPYITYYRENAYSPWVVAISSEYVTHLNTQAYTRTTIMPFKTCTCGQH